MIVGESQIVIDEQTLVPIDTRREINVFVLTRSPGFRERIIGRIHLMTKRTGINQLEYTNNTGFPSRKDSKRLHSGPTRLAESGKRVTTWQIYLKDDSAS
jgi:hypothetical protein